MSFNMCGSRCTIRADRAGRCLLPVMSLLLYLSVVSSVWGTGENGAVPRTWKAVSELSAEELAQVDLRTDTPRHPEYPYLPAEPYPFTPPYTAEEMGYRAMEFTQRPRWSCVYANLFGSISSEGALLGQGRAVNLVAYPLPVTVPRSPANWRGDLGKRSTAS